ncbi:11271_t:CDS:2 [Scutellospora calospora]|uniref:11271_t:CDS:1 n=1 Tax=Scutellospora calospora TaxID=85575 RepID=A0ACA9K6I2_9GLOM|nr:11271_t:CDS:2 [Scutellospora calospora]
MSIASYLSSLQASEWLSVVTLLICVYVAHFYFRYFTRENPLPGPTPLPIIGNLHQMGMGTDIAAWAHRLQCDFGEDIFETYYGSQRTIWIGRADLAVPVLASSTKNNYFNRGVSSPGMREIGLETVGIAANRDYESWKFNRKFFSTVVMSPRFLKKSISATEKLFIEAELYLNNLGSKTQIDMSKFLFRFFVDSMHLSATGKPAHAMAGFYNSLVVPKDKRTDHPKELLDATEEIIFSIKNEFKAARFMFFFPPFIRHYILRYYNNKYVNNVKRFDEILLSIIRKRKAEIDAIPDGDSLNPDMLTLLLTTNTSRDLGIISTGEITRPMTEDEIRADLKEIFSVGIDTTSDSFCYIIWHMCKNPLEKDKVLKELNEVLGTDPTKSIPYESLDRLKYTEAFVKEVLRLNPVLPFLWKMATNDDTLGGMKWKAGTSVFINVYGTQTHAKNWDKPEEFIPARHLEGTKTDRNAYIPFGGGPRLCKCPGKNFAMATLKLLTALLIRRFDIELVDKNAPLKTSFTMVRHCDELKVYLRPKIPITG